jgi:predicted small secreted protein
MRKKILSIALLSLLCTVSGCETMKGVGRDITNTADGAQRILSPSKKGWKSFCNF